MTRLSATEEPSVVGTDTTSPSKTSLHSHSRMLKAKNSEPTEVEMQPLALSEPGDDDSEVFQDEAYHKLHASDVVEVVSFWDAYQGRATWETAFDHFLYPPNLPRSCQLLRPENIAIPACYLLVGLLQGLSSVMVGVFPLDLGATEAQQTTLRSLRGLPASFKLIFGFWSDNVPIMGYRRKPYMLAGWFIASASQFSLLFFSNLQLDASGAGCFADANADVDPVVPTNAPTIPFFAASLLLFGMGFWLADVMGDSMVAEKAKLEPPHSRGSVQSSCYSYRFFGLMVAAPLATYLYTASGPAVVVRLLAFLPLSILPLVYILEEVRQTEVPSTWDQCSEIWMTVSSRAVWQPLGFVFAYNLLQVSNSAWREFQRTVLHFTSCQINLLGLVAYVLLYVGILTYKYFLMHYSWQKIYLLTTLANGFFSIFQILLIYGITFGLPAFWFALGDDVFLDFVEGIQFLPTTIMMVHLCPVGSEGAAYAMFTTVHNAALNLSSSISTLMLGIWDVSKSALADGDITGMANLTYLTTGLQVSAIFLVGLLPHYKEDLQRLTGHSSTGGIIFLGVTFFSVGYSIFVSLMNICFPGWSGES